MSKLTRWIEKVQKSYMPTNADLLLVGNFLKDQILDRTERGLDADGRPFAPYSEKHAYYWNPYTGKDKTNWGAQNRSVNRMVQKLGGRTKTGIIRDGKGKVLGQRSGTGTSIKFSSYGAFKRALGRGNVDLTGPRAPHMLQSLQVRVAPGRSGVILGVYGQAAARAYAHQYGNPSRGLPQRRFIGATPEDRVNALKLLSASIRGRMLSGDGQ